MTLMRQAIDSQISRIRKADADVLILCTLPPSGVSVVKQIRAAGIDLPMGGAAAFDGDYWLEGVPDLSDFFFPTTGSLFGDDPNPKTNELFDKIEDETGERPVAAVYAQMGYSMIEALATAKKLGRQDGYFCPSQFESEWNVEENRVWLGPEILSQLPEGTVPDALVMGVGTGGTLVGVGQAFRAVNPDVKIFAVEPDESCTILCGETGKHAIEGISDGFVPGIFERHGGLVDGVFSVTSKESIEAMRCLAREHGMFVGPSSGAHLVVARRVREEHPELKTVVTLFCDEGEKYISDHFRKPGGGEMQRSSCGPS